MTYRQEHISPYPPFQPAPMLRNAAEERFLFILVIVIWTGLGLMLWMKRRRRK